MKKALLVVFLCFVLVYWVVRPLMQWNWVMNGRGVSVRISEGSGEYCVKAYYDRHKTYSVQRFMDQELHSSMFTNSKVDADVTLDDRTRFYVRTKPGAIYIKMDKDENDAEAYLRMKDFTEKLKHKLTEEQ